MSDPKSIDIRESRPVAPAEAGMRLDRFLADALPGLSRSRIKALLQDGKVVESGETISDASYRVKPGQVFRLEIPEPEPAALAPQPMRLEIVHEDADLLVIDKPAGLVVHPGPGQPDSTLVNALLAHCGRSLSGVGGVKRPGIVHRLDKDTSGLIVVAKNDETHRSLSAQFATRTIDRTYAALVWGVPRPPAGRIEGNIGRHPRNRKKMAVVPEDRGKPAATNYRLLQQLRGMAALLECRLETGRTHQIRVHLAHIGHPVMGDPVYSRQTPARRAGLSGDAAELVKNLKRQALHATVIGFEHPRSGERLKFTSDLPYDIKQIITALDPS